MVSVLRFAVSPRAYVLKKILGLDTLSSDSLGSHTLFRLLSQTFSIVPTRLAGEEVSSFSKQKKRHGVRQLERARVRGGEVLM